MGNRGNRWKSCEIVARARGIVGNRWEIVGNRGNGAQSLIPEQCVSPQLSYLPIYPPTPWGHQACGIVLVSVPPPVVLPLGSSTHPRILTHAPPPTGTMHASIDACDTFLA